ncbi:tRNA uridine(34) 5-carboxymethylaminomethyl modification radical SAM/GNAT enzyme Elp3 [Candidatus Woesearchaeota archaeon]|nr:tRNA uridine(34) 5-carboxymethylaminomethyl modification radical SAM/GNAT enzyme Elp3 [Candidatus Woesearchaeota archaeon]
MPKSDFFKEIIEHIKQNKPNKARLSKQKVRLCSKHKLKRIPTDIEILLHAKKQDLFFLRKYLQTKPTRTISGVAVVAVMTYPFSCPHGRCVQCPGGPDSFFGTVPQSYTGKEPATMRAIRNRYDSYLQIFNRLEQYVVLGQSPEKVELIIMGGTFPSFPKKYQEEFIYYAFKAMNDFSRLFYKNGNFNIIKFKQFFELPGKVGDKNRVKNIHEKLLAMKNKDKKTKKDKKNLEQEQRLNEKSNIRCVGLTIETRPDYAKQKHANEMLRMGCTRVELGVQSVFDDALKRINRGHDVAESICATQILKDLGFKINYHMMLGLPGINFLQEIEGLKKLFDNPDFRPDMLKLYPCMVLKGTRLHEDWKKERYKPLTTQQAAKLIIEFKKHIPEYIRIMRVQRDIPTKMTEAGVDKTNLRQYMHEKMKKHGVKCRCIRCREIRDKEIKGKVELKIINYQASKGKEYFISLENKDHILGFCRLRFPSQSLRKEMPKNSAIIRELHVYGTAAAIKGKGKVQHKGFGKRLLRTAESIAKKNKKKKMIIISGVGVRDYYRNQGYKKQGPYMVKNI